VSLSFSDPFLAAAAVGYKKNEPMYTERCTDSNFWYSTGADMLFSKSRSRRKRMPQRAEYANLEGGKPVAQIRRQTRMEFLDNSSGCKSRGKPPKTARPSARIT